MSEELIRRPGVGRSFTLGGEQVVIKVGADETGGAYSLMHWQVPAAPSPAPPMHAHQLYEETFLVLDGDLEFTLEDESQVVATGDFIRIPPGTRHSYVNRSDRPAELLVTFVPGGIEEHFFKYRDQPAAEFDFVGFLTEARDNHATTYELGG